MSYLLDTHAFLWFVNDHHTLSATAKDIIEDQQSLIYLSTASIWEMAIKLSLKKLAVPGSLQDFVELHAAKNELAILNITAEHAETVASLAFQNSGHRDPFDRMIIAQSICEDLTIITRDPAFEDYQIQGVW